MLVLALDTTTRQGSIALVRDGAVLATYSGNPDITHGERLPADLMHLLDTHGLQMADVDTFAVASGPGSFTGLRIGIAAMQGLALAGAKSLVGVSALDALNAAVRAFAAGRTDGELAAWMDAQRGQVFSAVYANGAAVEPALVDTPDAVLARWRGIARHPRVFVGDGALAYRSSIVQAFPEAHIVEPVPLLAPAIAQLAAGHVDAFGAAPPDAIRPIYIRRSDAELARDRRDGVSTAPSPALERTP